MTVTCHFESVLGQSVFTPCLNRSLWVHMSSWTLLRIACWPICLTFYGFFTIFRDPTHSPGGELVLGGTDPNYYTGNFNYLETREVGKWEITMKGWDRCFIIPGGPVRNCIFCFSFGFVINLFSHSVSVSVGAEMMFCSEGCTAVIDTGSSYITGPASSVSALMKTIGAQLDETGVSFKQRLKFYLKK